MNKDIDSIVLSKAQIEDMVKDAAAWIDERFKDTDTTPLAISVLKGSIFFYCDVVRAMQTQYSLILLPYRPTATRRRVQENRR